MMNSLIIPTLIVSVLALIAGCTALVIVLAFKFSTHQIEWRPLVSEKAEADAEQEQEEIAEDEEAILKEALSLQRSKKKKDEDPLDTILETNNF